MSRASAQINYPNSSGDPSVYLKYENQQPPAKQQLDYSVRTDYVKQNGKTIKVTHGRHSGKTYYAAHAVKEPGEHRRD